MSLVDKLDIISYEGDKLDGKVRKVALENISSNIKYFLLVFYSFNYNYYQKIRKKNKATIIPSHDEHLCDGGANYVEFLAESLHCFLVDSVFYKLITC